MSHEIIHKRIEVSRFVSGASEDAPADGGPIAFTSTGDKFYILPAAPIDVYRFGLITQDLLDVGAQFTLPLDHRVLAGSDVGRTEVATLSTGTVDVAAGKVVYKDVILPVAEATQAGHLSSLSPGTKQNVGPTGPLHVRPGEEVVIEVTDAADTAGTGRVWIEYAAQGFAQPNAVVGTDGEDVIEIA